MAGGVGVQGGVDRSAREPEQDGAGYDDPVGGCQSTAQQCHRGEGHAAGEQAA